MATKKRHPATSQWDTPDPIDDAEPADWELPKVKTRYRRGRQAYCKYCSTVHTQWQRRTEDDVWFAQGFPFEVIWLCQYCDHATKDEFMQIGGRESQVMDANGVWHRWDVKGREVKL